MVSITSGVSVAVSSAWSSLVSGVLGFFGSFGVNGSGSEVSLSSSMSQYRILSSLASCFSCLFGVAYSVVLVGFSVTALSFFIFNAFGVFFSASYVLPVTTW